MSEPVEGSLRRPEILAPAGDEESMRAAVRAGADAVYFGLQGFNARARAKNFDTAALARTMAFLHGHGVKGYVTLNTLVFDDELHVVERAIRTAAGAGVDAVIVQDFGVAKMVRAIAPELALHASTQMTCTDAGAVEMARDLGASRVILARELSLEDIARIREQSDMELEVFVHGALCIAYSGQCLTSEAIGGRSANRGACAQACRLPYEAIVDGKPFDTGDKAYLLSPEDLETSDLTRDLMQLGVSSLKIEGRLKGPEYVASTTRLYRAAIEGALDASSSLKALDSLRETALQTFTRGSGPGFLQGVNHQRLVEGRSCDHRGLEVGDMHGIVSRGGRDWLTVTSRRSIARGDGLLVEGAWAGEGEIGGRVWAIEVKQREVERTRAGDEALIWFGPEKPIEVEGTFSGARRLFRSNDPAVARSAQQKAKEARRRPVAFTVAGAVGEVPRFRAETTDGLVAEVEGDTRIEASVEQVVNLEAVLLDKLGRLGDSPFALASIRVDVAENALIPVSSINRARRALTEILLTKANPIQCVTETTAKDLLARSGPPEDRSPARGGLFVLCRKLEQAHAALDAGADGVVLDFLDLVGTGRAVAELRARGPVHITLAPPRIRKPGEEKIDRYLASLAPDAFLVRGLGALHESDDSPIERIGDFSLNVTNSLSASAVLARGLAAFTPSFDLDATQLGGLLESPFAPWAEVVLHHPMPLFHMEHCAIAHLLSSGKDHHDCGRPCDRHQLSLRDRAGMEHPVEADVGCRNTVFHARSQSAAGLVVRLVNSGVRRFRIELVREGREEVERLVTTYRRLIRGETSANEVWRNLKTEAGYGVVRGTLRVLS